MSTTRLAFSIWRQQFTPAPSLDTARRWAAAGKIQLWQAAPGCTVYVIDEPGDARVTTDELLADFRRAG